MSIEQTKYKSELEIKLSEQNPEPATKKTLEPALEKALEALLSQQNTDGSWDYDMEEGVNLEVEYILYRHFVCEEIETERVTKFGNYIRRRQLSSGGWAKYPDGPFDLNLSVVTYLALKTLGDSEDSEHMRSAAKAIRKDGGAEASSTLIRTMLAVYGVLPLTAIPKIPIEFVLLPRWFPLHTYNMGYFFRVVLIPMLVILTIQRSTKFKPYPNIGELFLGNPIEIKPVPRAKGQSFMGYTVFKALDFIARVVKPLIPDFLHQMAIGKAVRFVSERTSDKCGFGGCIHTMQYADMMFAVLGYDKDHLLRLINRQCIDKLIVDSQDEAYLVECQTPIWNTILAVLALYETRDQRAIEAAKHGIQYLIPRQILNVRGDWTLNRPNHRPGGWAFYPDTPHYPDTDDTSLAVLAMLRFAAVSNNHDLDMKESIARGIEWIMGMQCREGGWGAFEADCTTKNWHNSPIIFTNDEDRTTFTDIPSVDITCRCLAMLITAGETLGTSEPAQKALKFILDNQCQNGSWLGSWGVAYIFGTWCALTTLTYAGIPKTHRSITLGIQWVLSIQNKDGGWGETPNSYKTAYRSHENTKSTATQTAWSVLGLMAAGEFGNPAVEAGVNYLLKNQNSIGQWDEDEYMGVLLPNLAYVKYHGYSKYYPMMALARYRNFKRNKFNVNTKFMF